MGHGQWKKMSHESFSFYLDTSLGLSYVIASRLYLRLNCVFVLHFNIDFRFHSSCPITGSWSLTCVVLIKLNITEYRKSLCCRLLKCNNINRNANNRRNIHNIVRFRAHMVIFNEIRVIYSLKRVIIQVLGVAFIGWAP